jgi:hypothetical protein
MGLLKTNKETEDHSLSKTNQKQGPFLYHPNNLQRLNHVSNTGYFEHF